MNVTVQLLGNAQTYGPTSGIRSNLKYCFSGLQPWTVTGDSVTFFLEVGAEI